METLGLKMRKVTVRTKPKKKIPTWSGVGSRVFGVQWGWRYRVIFISSWEGSLEEEGLYDYLHFVAVPNVLTEQASSIHGMFRPCIFIFTSGHVFQAQAQAGDICGFYVDVKVPLDLAGILSQSVWQDFSSWVVRVGFSSAANLSSHFCLNFYSKRQVFQTIHTCKK